MSADQLCLSAAEQLAARRLKSATPPLLRYRAMGVRGGELGGVIVVAIETAVPADDRLGPAIPDHERLTASGARLHGAVVGERSDLAHGRLDEFARVGQLD